MISIEEIKEIHIELTDKCNAACPNCPRNLQGGKTNEWIENCEISLEQFKEYFPPHVLENLNGITFCGNNGDPSLCTDLIEIISYTNQFDISIQLNTNGSTRTTKFWTRLSEVLNKDSTVVFSIDGLKDTNHIYRRNTQWDKIISNLKCLENSKAYVIWEYLIFDHNAHQKEEARQLAKELKLDEIRFKNPFGFSDLSNSKSYMPVYKKDETLDYFLYRENEKPGELLMKKLTLAFKRLPKINFLPLFYKDNDEGTQIEDLNIECRTKTEKEIFVNAKGEVFPCCFLSAHLPQVEVNTDDVQFIDFYRRELLNKNSLKTNSLDTILRSNIFERIEETWESRKDCIKLCKKYCHKKEGIFSTLYESEQS